MGAMYKESRPESSRNNGMVQMELNSTRSSTISRINPLIILGGGRQNAGENMESGETDDGGLNERIGKALREFLPRWFPGKFESDEDNWEMEWVNNFLFPQFFLLDNQGLRTYLTDCGYDSDEKDDRSRRSALINLSRKCNLI